MATLGASSWWGPSAPGLEPDALRVLTIGDSNGAGPEAWPTVLGRELSRLVAPRPVAIWNASRPGKTLFAERGQGDSPAIRDVGHWLRLVRRAAGGIDEVVLCLGTNDVQQQFERRGLEMEAVASGVPSIARRVRELAPEARLTVVSPPPLVDARISSNPGVWLRWGGSQPRLALLAQLIAAEAARAGARYVDAQTLLAPGSERWVGPDGVHLSREGQQRLGRLIAHEMAEVSAPSPNGTRYDPSPAPAQEVGEQ